tara:strand:- start:374 stop:766 length:393 start_codon:yes stop_codon:yes gene_type:complete
MTDNRRLTALSVRHLNVTDNIRIKGKLFVDTSQTYISMLVSENSDPTGAQVITAVAAYDSSASGNKTFVSFRGDAYFAGNAYFSGDISLQSNIPENSLSIGTRGTVTWDNNYIYVCTHANTWKRTPLSSW